MHARLARTAALAAALVVALAACSTPSAATQQPGSTTVPPAATTAGQPTTAGQQTSAPVAGEPCSFLSAAQVTAVMGTPPVEIKERAGRGDCDYWLDAAKTAKVNVGMTRGADGAALFESTKALGEILPVPNLGDDAYMLVLADLGTIVVAKQGDFVFSVQLLNTMDSAEQAIRVINLAKAVVEGR